jgi:hypothetical protein
MNKPDPISEEKIKKINKVVKDMVFTYKGDIGSFGKKEFKYQFRIVGQKHMISVGEYYNFLTVDITVVDGSPETTFVIRHLPDMLSDYRTLSGVTRDISEELSYFFGSDYVRVVTNDGKIKIGNEYQEKIDELPDLIV